MQLMDYYILTVDNVWDEREEGGLITQNAARYIDQDRDRFERKRLYGRIEAVPIKLTGKPHQPLDPGNPNYRLHVGHDVIQERINEGLPDYLNWEQFYNTAIRENLEFLSLKDYPCDVQVGETVIFHPGVTEPSNLIDKNKYWCRPDQIIAACRETLVPQANYVLVDPIELPSSAGGFILDIESQFDLLRGIVRFSSGVLRPGQMIGFIENADWSIEIDGHRYFAMRDDEIMLVIEQSLAPSIVQ